jgi:hypothetical protein
MKDNKYWYTEIKFMTDGSENEIGMIENPADDEMGGDAVMADFDSDFLF